MTALPLALSAGDALLTHNPNEFNPQRLTSDQALTCDQDHGYTAEQKAANGGTVFDASGDVVPDPDAIGSPNASGTGTVYGDGDPFYDGCSSTTFPIGPPPPCRLGRYLSAWICRASFRIRQQ